jgi:hypothetical protein
MHPDEYQGMMDWEDEKKELDAALLERKELRSFKDGTTFDSPAMWVDSQNRLWHGPICENSTMHFALFEGFNYLKNPIWVLRASACPEDCVKINKG